MNIKDQFETMLIEGANKWLLSEEDEWSSYDKTRTISTKDKIEKIISDVKRVSIDELIEFAEIILGDENTDAIRHTQEKALRDLLIEHIYKIINGGEESNKIISSWYTDLYIK